MDFNFQTNLLHSFSKSTLRKVLHACTQCNICVQPKINPAFALPKFLTFFTFTLFGFVKFVVWITSHHLSSEGGATLWLIMRQAWKENPLHLFRSGIWETYGPVSVFSSPNDIWTQTRWNPKNLKPNPKEEKVLLPVNFICPESFTLLEVSDKQGLIIQGWPEGPEAYMCQRGLLW